MERTYPRVLYISFDSLNHLTDTGNVFVNLFRGWPADALAQVYAHQLDPDPAICQLSWRVSVENVPADRAVRRLLGHKRVAELGPGIPQTSSTGNAGSRIRLRTTISAWADCFPFHLDAGFWNWLRAFSPEVILTDVGSVRQIGLVLRVADRLSLPVVPFFNDDWPSTHFAGDALKAVPRWLLLRSLDKLLAKASLGAR